MKTQINHLQRGNSAGIVGTSHIIRSQIATLVKAENPERMTIRVKGVEITLDYKESTTQKSFWYVSDILPTEIVKMFCPGDMKALKHPELVHYRFCIHENMMCDVFSWRRRNINAWWKPGQTVAVDEKEVVII